MTSAQDKVLMLKCSCQTAPVTELMSQYSCRNLRSEKIYSAAHFGSFLGISAQKKPPFISILSEVFNSEFGHFTKKKS